MSNGEFNLDEKANLPRKVKGDEGEVQEHDLSDMIEYERHKQAAGATVPPYGMRVARMVPNGTITPGAAGPNQRY